MSECESTENKHTVWNMERGQKKPWNLAKKQYEALNRFPSGKFYLLLSMLVDTFCGVFYVHFGDRAFCHLGCMCLFLPAREELI